ncbi:MAG: hypothetical protein WC764_01155 [Candidatus Paceibacterota bacterium]|jgi:hypothetical protein
MNKEPFNTAGGEDITDEILEINEILAGRAAEIRVNEIINHARATGSNAVLRRAERIINLPDGDPNKSAQLDDLRLIIAFFELPAEKQKKIRRDISGASKYESSILGAHDIKAVLSAIEYEEVESKFDQDKQEFIKEVEERKQNEKPNLDSIAFDQSQDA